MMTIAIIGGGATGLAVVKFLDELSNQICPSLQMRIVLIEKSPVIGPGLAYSTTYPGHLINMPTDTMGFSNSNPFDFQNWYDQQDYFHEYTSNFKELAPRYLPRYLYGQYLTDIASKLFSYKENYPVSLEVITDEVISLEEHGDGLKLYLKNKGIFPAHQAVLALGNLPSTNYIELEGIGGYFSSPWPWEKLKKIPFDQDIVILGSSLTAVDVARTLINQGHTGSIKFVSRSGLLPKVQASSKKSTYLGDFKQKLLDLAASSGPDLKCLTWQLVFKLFHEEIKKINDHTPWKLYRCPSKTPVEILREEVKVAESGAIGWQEVLGSTSDIIEVIWHAMPLKHRLEFDRKFLSIWMTNRHAMPLPNAKFILQLLESQQLQVLRGNIKAKYEPTKGVFQLSNGSQQLGETLWLINGTGAGMDLAKTSMPLLRQLMDDGYLTSHPCGGIDVDFSSFNPFNQDGKLSPNIYVLGQLTRGVHFYTNAIDRNLAHARRVASQVLMTLLPENDCNPVLTNTLNPIPLLQKN